MVPLVHAFLSGKKTELYKEVLEVVKEAVERFHTVPCVPTKIMSDIFPTVPLSGCYFHLGQIIYRRVQGDGLQEQYQDPLDRIVK